MAKKHIPLHVKLAATLWELQRMRSVGTACFPRDDAKAMSADQFVSLFQWDHAVQYANGGSNHFTNLTPMFIGEHREKTAKVDIPQIAKRKRIEKTWREFTAAMTEGKKPPRKQSRWPKRRLTPKRK